MKGKHVSTELWLCKVKFTYIHHTFTHTMKVQMGFVTTEMMEQRPINTHNRGAAQVGYL